MKPPLLKPMQSLDANRSTQRVCPGCCAAGMSPFYEVESVPVHDVLLMDTRQAALGCPRGDIVLGSCSTCGFISNLAFQPGAHYDSSRYEETQGFSSTFSGFHRRLAARLVERYDLRDKDIVEIGCGKGEFLTLLCELGDNRGTGYDPAYVSERNQSPAKNRITFINEWYCEENASHPGDFLCCKMTLEHIQHPLEFVSTVRRSIGEQTGTTVFFQVPNVVRVLRDLAFWDVYYEHCSYFSPGSLARLFRKCGFDVIELASEYDDQYLTLTARPAEGEPGPAGDREENPQSLARDVAHFSSHSRQKRAAWKRKVEEMHCAGQRVVLWGAGSKGVAFLTTLHIRREIEYAIDVNPFKHGTYLAGTGQQIMAPDFLRQYRPDVVLVMNPIYSSEIRRELDAMGLAPELIAV